MKNNWKSRTAIILCLALLFEGQTVNAFAFDYIQESEKDTLGFNIETDPMPWDVEHKYYKPYEDAYYELGYYVQDDGTICIDGYRYQNRGELVIPSTIDGITVTKINGGFSYGNWTGELIIPDTVKEIGSTAFDHCKGFTGTPTIGSSVEVIGSYAFSGCTGFTGSLTIPGSVKEIGSAAFSYCTGFTGNLGIPNGVTTIGYSAFEGCSGFTGDLIIPDSVTSIDYSAFKKCTGFDGKLVISENLSAISSETFSDCGGLTGDLVIPGSVTTIGSLAFGNCNGFTGLKLEDGIITIGDNAFHGCSGLNCELIIPNTVKTIKNYAFYECSGFSGDLVIPDNVTTLGSGAFFGCEGFDGNLTISNGISIIEIGVFTNCSGLKGNLSIPTNVKTIKSAAFKGCSSLSGDLIIPDNVTSLEQSAFDGCSGFNGKLSISKQLKTIGNWTFTGCSGLTGKLEIPNGVESIGLDAFRNCSHFTGDLVIPDSVTTIEGRAFQDCSGLNGSLTLGQSLTSISYWAFYNSGLKGTVTIPSSLKTIDQQAFWGCEYIDEIINNSSTFVSLPLVEGQKWIDKETGKEIEYVHAGKTGVLSNKSSKSVRELDVWSFNNISRYFGDVRNGYMISEDSLNNLLLETKQTDKEWITRADNCIKYLKRHRTKVEIINPCWWANWNGACEGMSRIVCLVNNKTLGLDKLGLDEYDDLSSIKAADYEYFYTKEDGIGIAENVISFYYLQQFLPTVLDKYKEMMSVSENQYDAIVNLGNALKSNPDETGLVVFTHHQFADGTGTEHPAHTVAAYGYMDLPNGATPEFPKPEKYKSADGTSAKQFKYEYNDYSKYNHCILIYDPDNPDWINFGENSCANIYYNDNNEWIIPFYISSADVKNNGESGYYLKMATADPDYINTVNYSDGHYRLFDYSKYNYADIGQSNRFRTDVSGWVEEKDDYLFGDNEDYTLIGVSNGSATGNNIISIPTSDKYYVKAYENGLNATIYMGNHLVEMASSVPGEAEVGTSGASEVKLTAPGDLFVGLTANDGHRALDEPNVYAIGEGVTQLSVNQVEDGLQVESDELSNVTIYADDPDGKAKLIEIDTEAEKLRLVDNDGKLEAVADEDGDGEFETICGTEQPIEKTQEGLWVDQKDLEDIKYSGTAVKPEIHVYDSDKLLKQSVDYTISYKNNKNAYTLSENDAGFNPKIAPTITITGKGNYDSKDVVYFKILPQDIGGEDFSADDITLPVSTKPQKINPVIYWNGKALKQKTDYTCAVYKKSDTEFKNPLGLTISGDEPCIVRFTGTGNFTDTRDINLTFTKDQKLVSSLKIDKVPAAIYTGSPITPEPAVRDGSTVLVRGVHYSLTYASNVNPGTGYVIITGIPENGYSGTKRVPFKINAPKGSKAGAYDISPEKDTANRIQVECASTVDYVKGGAKPAVTVKFTDDNNNIRTLTEGIDYKLSYKGNTAVSTNASVVITGKGAFKGSRSQGFAINAKNISKVSAYSEDKVYQNKANIYATKITLTDSDGKKLLVKKDYQIDKYTYLNDTEVTVGGSKEIRKAGTEIGKQDILPVDTVIEVTLSAVNGSGYTGTAKPTYRISEASISSAKVAIPTQIYTGNPIKLDPTAITVSVKGQKLTTSDFEIVGYENNTNKGTAKVTIRGKGNYGGYKTQTFKIKAKGFHWWWRK